MRAKKLEEKKDSEGNSEGNFISFVVCGAGSRAHMLRKAATLNTRSADDLFKLRKGFTRNRLFSEHEQSVVRKRLQEYQSTSRQGFFWFAGPGAIEGTTLLCNSPTEVAEKMKEYVSPFQ